MKRIGKKRIPVSATKPKRAGDPRRSTGRTQIEAALRESEAQYRQLFENSILAISQTALDGRLVRTNLAYARMYGYASPEQMMAEVTDIGHQLYANPEDRKEVLRILSEKGVMGPREFEVFRRDGSRIRVEVQAQEIREVTGKLLGYQASHVDITERKRAEDALHASEELYRMLFDASPEGVLLVGSDGLIKSANQAQSRMFRYDSPGELVGLPPGLLVIPALREYGKDVMRRRLSGEDVPFVEYRFLRKDGSEFWGYTSSTILRNTSGSITGYLCITRDTTDRKRAEEELRASHEQYRALAARIEQVREEERAALARELHDELGQGLTALQIDLAWLDVHLRTAGPADLPVLRDKIANLVPRAERLIETTQAISSTMRPGVLDDLGLVAAVEWLAADFEKRTGLACVATLPAADIALDLSLAVVLFRIVQEALTNVIRHAGASRVEIRLRATEGELALEVEDDGRGITPQQVADPRSLGLFSMRERIAALGGTVDFRSEAGRGTIVSVRVTSDGGRVTREV